MNEQAPPQANPDLKAYVDGGKPPGKTSTNHASDIGTTLRTIAGGIAALACIFGGVQLLGITPTQENNMLGMIAHGLGMYCIGKGIFVGAELTR